MEMTTLPPPPGLALLLGIFNDPARTTVDVGLGSGSGSSAPGRQLWELRKQIWALERAGDNGLASGAHGDLLLKSSRSGPRLVNAEPSSCRQR